MIIELPKDIIQIKKQRKQGLNAFRFNKQHSRLIIPTEVRNSFEGLGVDLFVSKSEKALYLTFGKPEKTQFHINERNGYVGCAHLFQWAVNAECPIFEDYEYEDYQVDVKNKIAKVKLVRK